MRVAPDPQTQHPKAMPKASRGRASRNHDTAAASSPRPTMHPLLQPPRPSPYVFDVVPLDSDPFPARSSSVSSVTANDPELEALLDHIASSSAIPHVEAPDLASDTVSQPPSKQGNSTSTPSNGLALSNSTQSFPSPVTNGRRAARSQVSPYLIGGLLIKPPNREVISDSVQHPYARSLSSPLPICSPQSFLREHPEIPRHLSLLDSPVSDGGRPNTLSEHDVRITQKCRNSSYSPI
ncbi:hypothetical protein BC830DRAFT_939123 [Chytriomyces sp. MP71]|nr:hypothetical protein BC830DRAFT_939123 [Chytriomyces sp. MP71]